VLFINVHKERFGVEPMCRVLSQHHVAIAPSTFYAAMSRKPSTRSVRDRLVLVEIERIYHNRQIGRGLYGARKVWDRLKKENALGAHPVIGHVGKGQVERIMKYAGLQGAHRRKRFKTTMADPAVDRPEDLVKRNFTATRPNQLWVVDFTYVATWSGVAFTAFVTDVYSRRIVGWRTASRMPTALPLDALEMALWIRAGNNESVTGMVHHSDAGSQYTSIIYRNRLDDIGALASIGTVGDSYDNALAESTNGLYKTECVRHDGPFHTVSDLELATCSWVYWFNTNRSHSSIGYNTPIEHENAYYHHHNTGQHQLTGESSLH
jgi:putative transposase